jgi:ribosomal protein L29
MAQNVSTKGTNKEKNKLDLPNAQELNQMNNEELTTTLDQVNTLLMVAGANKTRGLLPAGGNTRQMRILKARILTIQGQRGRGK